MPSPPKFDLRDLFDRGVCVVWTPLEGLETEIAVALDVSPTTEGYPSMAGHELVPFQKVIDDWVPGLNVEERIKELFHLTDEAKYAVTSSKSSKGAYTDEDKRLDALIVMAGV